MAFKFLAFAEESEVRLQIFAGDTLEKSKDLKFRDGAMGLTPYVEIHLAPQDANTIPGLREIIVGPQPNQAEAVRAVKQLLAKNEYEDVVVHTSKVPLRP